MEDQRWVGVYGAGRQQRRVRMYPAVLVLSERPCLVVGGGRIAARKANGLLLAGAIVTVVAPQFGDELQELAGDCELAERRYRLGEAGDYVLVIAATDDPAVNEQVYADAVAAGVPVNVVDRPELCTFIAPAVVRRGALQVTVCTGGAFPALSRRLRRDLEARLPAAYEPLLSLLSAFREELREREPDAGARQACLRRIADGPEIDAFLEGDEKPLRKLLNSCA